MEHVVIAYRELVEACNALVDHVAMFEARMDDLATAISADQSARMDAMTQKGTLDEVRS